MGEGGEVWGRVGLRGVTHVSFLYVGNGEVVAAVRTSGAVRMSRLNRGDEYV